MFELPPIILCLSSARGHSRLRPLRGEEESNMAPDRARLTHLWNLAVRCAEDNPELSRFYANEISSTEGNGKTIEDTFWLKYCQHCCILFTADNCRVRLHPKRGKKKKQKDNKFRNKKEVLKLPRKLNHVGVFCKVCGRQSFHPGRARGNKPAHQRKSLSSVEQNDRTIQHTTPVLSKSAKSRRRSHSSKLKDLLLADERKKSTSTSGTPQLQDFLSSLGDSISFT